jgi:ferredoxin
MPQVTAQGRSFTCETGANLRQVLLEQGIDLYNGNAKFINCMSIGTCRTCAVHIEGQVSAVNWKDMARRFLLPHLIARNLCLACQTKVLGDIKVTKFYGFWGQGNELIW